MLCYLVLGAALSSALAISRQSAHVQLSTPQERHEQNKLYSFEQFVAEFARTYDAGSQEYARRHEIFLANKNHVVATNEGHANSWEMGVNAFMDWTPEEFKKMLGRKGHVNKMKRAFSLSEAEPEFTTIQTFNLSTVALPDDHDWRLTMDVAKDFFKDQGACGSCWATAAITALEGHLNIHHGTVERLSTQALVSCVENLEECGGTGGCEGALSEQAFEYIAKKGIPSAASWPYASFAGETGSCDSAKQTRHAQIGNFVRLAANKATPLLQALYQSGPVVVSADGSPWSFYSHGVFAGCEKDAEVNHAIVAEGFGRDTEVNKNYYLIRNSWGTDWGEGGYIRLERMADEDNYCGTDHHPEVGLGCKGGPSEVKVCGQCGILYDSCYPTNTKFVTHAEGGTWITPPSLKARQPRQKKAKKHN